MCIGVQPFVRQGRRSHYAHDADSCYPIGVVPSGRRGRARPRGTFEGIANRHGVGDGCPACVRRLHRLHLAHIRDGAPPV